MTLQINSWTHHLNHLVYSYFYFCIKGGFTFKIICNRNIKNGGAVLIIDNTTIFFDYSDDSKFMDIPENYSFYLKRSLFEIDRNKNIYPLNFNVPLAYKSHLILPKLDFNLLMDKTSRKELFRALDFFSLFTNSSHKVIDIKRFPKNIKDCNGKVLFHTRLWNPDNNSNLDEKERRRLQNDFRINACRIIKNTYKTASVGLYSDDLSKQLAPDLLLDRRHSNKNNYLNHLNNFDIGIADDGLKDTPGWKIGEYLFYGKAVITTPLKIAVENFVENKNYLMLNNRTCYQELPDKINELLLNKRYLEMAHENLLWSKEYIHPENYLIRILSNLKIHF